MRRVLVGGEGSKRKPGIEPPVVPATHPPFCSPPPPRLQAHHGRKKHPCINPQPANTPPACQDRHHAIFSRRLVSNPTHRPEHPSKRGNHLSMPHPLHTFRHSPTEDRRPKTQRQSLVQTQAWLIRKPAASCPQKMWTTAMLGSTHQRPFAPPPPRRRRTPTHHRATARHRHPPLIAHHAAKAASAPCLIP